MNEAGDGAIDQNGTRQWYQYRNWQSKCSFVAKSSSVLHLDVWVQTVTRTHTHSCKQMHLQYL